MKRDIVFAGVGGQGIVSAASMLMTQAVRLGFECKQNEVHGMAQRGGAVVCHVRFSDREIFSDIISKGTADIILATEPMEALRYVDYLSPDGVVISSNKPVKNIAYPETGAIISELTARCKSVIVDVESLTAELKNDKIVNVAMIGALSRRLDIEGLRDGILADVAKKFSKKGAGIVELNNKAFEFGWKSS